jgi:hypothetical protein
MKAMNLASGLLLLTTATAKQGTQSICLGSRPHIINYDFTGEQLEEIENATFTVQPDLDSNADCSDGNGIYHGDKTMCVGANVDPTCTAAAKDIALNQYVDCPSCFAGLTTDLFYSLSVKFFTLEEVTVGLQNSHLRGAAEVHAHTDKGVTLPTGKIGLISDRSLFTASFKVAGVIPVDIEVSVPTSFTYGVGIKGAIDATAGAELDVNLGDHSVTYQKGSGFSTHNGQPSYTFTPKLAVEVEAEADVTLGLDSKVELSIDKVISYDVRMQPSLPLKVDLENEDKKICIAGSADFVLSQEADVHFTLFGKSHDIYHYGPQQLAHYHKDDIFHTCIDLPNRDATVVV